MNESQLVRDYWEQFKATSGVNDNQFGEAYQFGDTEVMANELADLVNKGVKTATTLQLNYMNLMTQCRRLVTMTLF